MASDNFSSTDNLPNTQNIQNASQSDQSKLLASDISFLTHYGYSYETLRSQATRAQQIGVEAHEEMICAGEITSDQYYRCLADYLGLDFVTAPQLKNIQLTKSSSIAHALRFSSQIMHRDETGALVLVTAPKCKEIERLRHRLTQFGGLNQRIAIAQPNDIMR